VIVVAELLKREFSDNTGVIRVGIGDWVGIGVDGLADGVAALDSVGAGVCGDALGLCDGGADGVTGVIGIAMATAGSSGISVGVGRGDGVSGGATGGGGGGGGARMVALIEGITSR